MTTQEERLKMAVERLVSCRHNIVADLRALGVYNLALRVEHDLAALAALWMDHPKPKKCPKCGQVDEGQTDAR